MLTKKSKRKNLRVERKNAQLMFNEITISNDCLRVILLCIIDSDIHCLREIQNISCVCRQWENIVNINCKLIKEVRLISEYSTEIFKGYINTDEYSRDIFSYLNKSMFHWSRLILYPKTKKHSNIYETTYKNTKGIWDYQC
jgi:hypothetical protein